MEIFIAQEQGRVPVTVMYVDGSLDAVTSDQFQARALEAIDAGHRDLLLDLQKVPYLSSAGLRVINVIYARLNPDASGTGVLTGKMKSPHFKLLNPTPRVLQVLQMAGYDMFLEIHQNLRDALASF
ncbi:MAG: STAS domain-containing protein [Acidobacteriota bacterium]